jgi:hypothetical protein
VHPDTSSGIIPFKSAFDQIDLLAGYVAGLKSELPRIKDQVHFMRGLGFISGYSDLLVTIPIKNKFKWGHDINMAAALEVAERSSGYKRCVDGLAELTRHHFKTENYKRVKQTQLMMEALEKKSDNALSILPVRVIRLGAQVLEELPKLESNEFYLSLESVLWYLATHMSLIREFVLINCLGSRYGVYDEIPIIEPAEKKIHIGLSLGSSDVIYPMGDYALIGMLPDCVLRQ